MWARHRCRRQADGARATGGVGRPRNPRCSSSCPPAGPQMGDPLGGGVAVRAVGRGGAHPVPRRRQRPHGPRRDDESHHDRRSRRAPWMWRRSTGSLCWSSSSPRSRPAASSRRVRARRRTVPSPDATLGAGHPHDLRRLRVVDRRRGLPPRDERLHGDDRRAGPGVPGRAAIGQDGHGEDADEEELGGALMHARTSGLCDYLARDEPDALRIARGIVAHLHWPRLGPGPSGRRRSTPVPAEEFQGIASVDVRVPFDVRRSWPRSRRVPFRGVQADVRGPAGLRVGSARRLSRGHRRQQRHPLLAGGPKGRAVHSALQSQRHAVIFVQNITGFMVGTRYEQGGIIKDGAKLINAVSNSTVPHLTLMVERVTARANTRWPVGPTIPLRFTLADHRIAVMGPKQLAGVLSIVRRNAAEAAGRSLTSQPTRSCRQRQPRRRSSGSRRRSSPPGTCGTTASSRTTPRPHRAGHRPHRGALGRRAGHGDVRGGAGTDGERESLQASGGGGHGERSPAASSGARTTLASRRWRCSLRR